MNSQRTRFVIGMAVRRKGKFRVKAGSKLLVATGVKRAVAGAGIGEVAGTATGFRIGSIYQ